MLTIAGQRGEGKSSCLVYYSFITNTPIIYDTTAQLKFIEERAASACLDIPKPLHYTEVEEDTSFLVDELLYWYDAHEDFMDAHKDQIIACTIAVEDIEDEDLCRL